MAQGDNLLRRTQEVLKRSKEVDERLSTYREASPKEFQDLSREAFALVERSEAIQDRRRVAEEEGASALEKERLQQDERTVMHDMTEWWQKHNEVHERLGITSPAQQEQYFKEVKEVTALTNSVAEELSAITAEISIETSKLKLEALKQQSTLSALAIGGIAAITNGPLGNAQSGFFLLWAAYGVLLLTLVVSLYLLHAVVVYVEQTLHTGGDIDVGRITYINSTYRVSWYGLPIGIALFVIFLIGNNL